MQTVLGGKLLRQEGNNPDLKLRSLIKIKCEKNRFNKDIWEVGLETATF
jgi:hypothetical protein